MSTIQDIPREEITPKKHEVSQLFIAAFDFANGDSVTCVTVCKELASGRREVLHTHYGDEAEMIYNWLMNGRGTIL
jgi:hypothetical protein